MTGRWRETDSARRGEASGSLVWFAPDSLLEGDGFELSVPRVMGGRFRTTVPAAIAVFEVAGTAVALPRHEGGWRTVIPNSEMRHTMASYLGCGRL